MNGIPLLQCLSFFASTCIYAMGRATVRATNSKGERPRRSYRIYQVLLRSCNLCKAPPLTVSTSYASGSKYEVGKSQMPRRNAGKEHIHQSLFSETHDSMTRRVRSLTRRKWMDTSTKGNKRTLLPTERRTLFVPIRLAFPTP